MVPVGSLLAGGLIYQLFNDGLANIFCLETLRHGTNPINYGSIRLFGGDPARGGSVSGSAKNFEKGDNIQNHFYVFKDNAFMPYADSTWEKLENLLLKRVLPLFCTARSGYNMVAQFLPSQDNVFANITRVGLGSIAALVCVLITPTVQFRFSAVESTRFHDDPDKDRRDFSYETNEKIEAWRVGLLGTIITGVNLDWFSRMKANPAKALTGLAQLVAAAGLTALFVYVMITFPPASLAMVIAPAIVGALIV